MIGLGSGIKDVADFNRRAGIAFRAVRFHPDLDLAMDIGNALREGAPLTEQQQQKVYRLVRRYHGQISDKLVTDYAESKSKGYYS